jgi:hypothetical protein
MNIRTHVVSLVSTGAVSEWQMLQACLRYLSQAQIQEMLEDNGWLDS